MSRVVISRGDELVVVTGSSRAVVGDARMPVERAGRAPSSTTTWPRLRRRLSGSAGVSPSMRR